MQNILKNYISQENINDMLSSLMVQIILFDFNTEQ